MHSGIYTYSKNLLSSRTDLSWIDVNFLNPESTHSIMDCVFKFGTNSVLLVAIPGLLFPQDFLRVLVIIFLFYFFLRAFYYVFFRSHILLQYNGVYFEFGNWYVLVNSPATFWNIFFSIFRKVMFCLYCLTMSQYLFSFPFFASSFSFISPSCINIYQMFCFGLFVPSCLWIFYFLCVFGFCRNFFTCPSSLISHHFFYISFRVPFRHTDFIKEQFLTCVHPLVLFSDVVIK